MKARMMAALAGIAVIVIACLVVYQGYFVHGSSQPQCVTIPGGTFARSQVANRTFGPVTEYALPGNDTWPSAITAAPDGSVWFAEQALPGVTHLFPSNGTIVEYAWPGYKPSTFTDCYPNVVSSGIALWNGRVWSADEFRNVIFGVNPSDGSVVTINATGRGSYPYWLAVGPDGDLWVTFDNTPAALARIYPNLTMSIIELSGTGDDSPLQLDFVNSSLALLSTVNISGNSTVSCFCTGHIYSFDPSKVGHTVAPSLVGGGYPLVLPTSASYSSGGVWVAQHYTSSVVRYDFESGSWTQYPTSRVPWTNTTLPYFTVVNDSEVWFNEHYANKIALLRPGSGTLTEISESDPPATTYTGIQNDEYIALSEGRLWFTSMTGNYVGFVNASYEPNFELTVSGTNEVSMARGGNASFDIDVSGSWTAPMGVSVSDSENYASTPTLISISPSASAVPVGSDVYNLGVDIAASPSLPAGNYTVAVTVTDGLIQQSAYLFITVT